MPYKDKKLQKEFAAKYREKMTPEQRHQYYLTFKASHRKDNWRRYSYKTEYGITLEDYDSLALKQEGRCALCHKIPDSRLVVDHNHDTKKVRALLCNRCNVGLGMFEDDPKFLLEAIRYLLGEDIEVILS